MSEEDALRIRIATPEDLDEIMNIALMATDENAVVSSDPEKLLQDIWPALHKDRGIVAVIGRPGGKIEGAILLRVGNLWYSNELVIEEKAIFIHPEYRDAKGGRARKLARFSKRLADDLELPLLIGVLSNERTEGKIRMYEREFGPRAGVFFLYRAKTGASSEGAG